MKKQYYIISMDAPQLELELVNSIKRQGHLSQGASNPAFFSQIKIKGIKSDNIFKCKKCGCVKFYQNKDRKACVDCHKKKMNKYYLKEEYRNKRKERYYKNEIFKRYGIRREKVKELLKNQNNGCAICGEMTTKLHIDHCHKTGKVRGLLCRSCNWGSGIFCGLG